MFLLTLRCVFAGNVIGLYLNTDNTMKKKFLLPVMALMLCVISCEDDKGSDNSSSSNPSKFKKLVSISTSDEDDSMTFSYDKNGNLVSAIEFEKEDYYEHITQYSWEGEEIIVIGDDY